MVSLNIKIDKRQRSDALTADAFESRVIADTGTFEAGSCLLTDIDSLGGTTAILPFYERIDLFDDEKISITSSVQNINDIAKTFTDYSNTFTIPASKRNNSILSHWYESAVLNGFDHRISYDAFIEIDTIFFREGKVSIASASVESGVVQNYKINFVGKVKQIKDVFQEDKLNTLDFSSLNHAYTPTAIQDRISNVGTSYDVRYPLFGSEKRYQYGSGSGSDNIANNAGAIRWDELFPAIKVSKIFERITAKYGISFQGSFLQDPKFSKLWFYCKKSKVLEFFTPDLKINFTSKSSTSFTELDLATDKVTPNWNFLNPSLLVGKVEGDLTITPTNLSINYKVKVFRNGVLSQTFENLLGVQTVTWLNINYPNQLTGSYEFFISSNSAITFTSTLTYRRRFGQTFGGGNIIATTTFTGTSASQSSVTNIDIASTIPDIKVLDFFMGIVKMLNLTIQPKMFEDNTFVIQPLEEFYASGQFLDITDKINFEKTEIDKPTIFKKLNFKYEKSENVLNNFYFETFNLNYGDLEYENPEFNSTSNYEISLPFENPMQERTSNFLTTSFLDKNLEPYVPKPVILYENGYQPLTFKFIPASGHVTLTNYFRFSNEINLVDGGLDFSNVYSLNFGNEQSTWYLNLQANSLYQTYYEKYIENLYNIQTRLVKQNANFNPFVLSNLQLKDRLIIRDKRYIINTVTFDITSGETNLELINDFRLIENNSFDTGGMINTEIIFLPKGITDLIPITIRISLGANDSFEILDTVATRGAKFCELTQGVFTEDEVQTLVLLSGNTTIDVRENEIPVLFTKNGVTVQQSIFITQNA
jgi:hypothetical protein